MRLLAIRGENLGALTAPFCVDFSAEPLASAGLFAITGPTGAGKSTLLDALCLALYHEVPRLALRIDADQRIPDGDGSLTARDPRNLLRRGAVRGYAEADFVDRAGRRWRARWSVSRARASTEGRLQQATASLTALDEVPELGPAGSSVPGTRSDVQRFLRALLGLSFEQFCRSVLLAQNDFAALLKAPRNERADLLEALTGTWIYARVSKRAHERAAEIAADLRRQREALDAVALLDAAEIAELSDERERLAAARAEDAAITAGLRQALAAAEFRRAQAARVAELSAQAAALAAALPAPEVRASLHAGIRLARLRQPLADWQSAQARVLQGEAEQAQALACWHVAIEARDFCAAAAGRAAQAVAQVQALDRDQRPGLLEARRVAEQHARQQADWQQLQAEGQRLQERRQALSSEAEQLAAEQDRFREHHDQWLRFATAHPELGRSGEPAGEDGEGSDLERLAPLLAQACRDAALLAAADAQAAARVHEVARAEAALAPLLSERDRRRSELAEVDTELRDHEAAAGDHPAETGLRQRLLAAEQLARAWAELAAAEAALRVAQQAGREASQRLEHCLAAEADCRQQHDRLEAATLARLPEALRLRLALRPGEACPVCGATAHPGLSEDALREGDPAELASLRRRLEGARAALRQAEAERLTADAESQRRAGIVREAREELARRRAADPDAGEMDPSRLPAHIAALQADLAGREESRRQLVQRLASARAAVDAVDQRLERAQQELGQARQALALATGASEAARKHLLEQAEALSPWPLLAEAARAGDVARLERHREVLAQGLMRVPPLRAALQQARLAEARRQVVVAQQQGLAREFAEFAKRREACEAALRTLDEQRAAQAVADPERSLAELDAALADALGARQAADSALARAGQEASLAAEREASARRWADEARRQLAAAEAAVLGQSEAIPELAGTAPEALAKSLEALPEDLPDRYARLEREEEALAVLQMRLEEARAALAEAPGEADESGLVEALAAAETRQAECQQRLGAIGERLRLDAEARDRHAAAAERLEQAQSVGRRWLRLAELIGSADGKRFKRHAQQYGLELLLDHANAELEMLAPRYRLVQGDEELSLLVVDRDLADACRSVHTLSGGESFLVSLALALGLSALSAERLPMGSLFIDEGFGSLDADTLNAVMAVLDRLQAQGRRVGVISHVPELADRIGVQIRVEPGQGGSRVSIG